MKIGSVLKDCQKLVLSQRHQLLARLFIQIETLGRHEKSRIYSNSTYDWVSRRKYNFNDILLIYVTTSNVFHNFPADVFSEMLEIMLKW